MRYLSVCSGIDAATVAWHPLGWSAVAFSEIEKFPSAVLAHHYPTVPNLGDMTEMDVEPLGDIDILVGGTPCQAFSVAGLRQSLGDARGNLTLSYVRLIHELVEHHKLRNAVWENVPGVLSTKDNAFGCFLGAIVGSDAPLVPPGGKRWPNSGMVSGPKGRAAWAIKDAQYFGLAQRRRRVFVVSDFGSGADPAAVLFELEGVRGNPAPSREARKDVAPTISARTKGGGGLGTDFDLDGGLIQTASTGEISHCLNAGGMGRIDYETETMIATSVTGEISHTLKAEGFDASEDGTGRGNPIVAFQSSQSGVRLGEVHATLDSNNGARRHNGALYGSAVRRLTPTECERLQGFPDNYTRIPMPKSGKKVGPVWAADGPRYKALGNSMAVPVMHWIGARIDRFMPREEVAAPVARKRLQFRADGRMVFA